MAICSWNIAECDIKPQPTKYRMYFHSFVLKVTCCPPRFAKAGDIKTHSFVCPSVHLSICPKNSNLAYIFWSIKDWALIFGMHDPCDKPFQLTPCRDLDLWPTCCWVGDHNSKNLLVCFPIYLNTFYKKLYLLVSHVVDVIVNFCETDEQKSPDYIIEVS